MNIRKPSFTFTEPFFQNPAFLQQNGYVSSREGLIDVTPIATTTLRQKIAYYWRKIAEPQLALTDVHETLLLSVRGIYNFVQHNTTDLYSAAFKAKLERLKMEGTLDKSLDNFKTNLLFLNAHFISASKHRKRCLYQIIMIINNLVRRIFRKKIINPKPMIPLTDQDIHQFIVYLKGIANTKTLQASSSYLELTVLEKINSELRLLFFDQKEECTIALETNLTLTVKTLRVEGWEKVQYGFKVNASSPYFLCYKQEEDEWGYYEITKSNYQIIPLRIKNWSIVQVDENPNLLLQKQKELLSFGIKEN